MEKRKIEDVNEQLIKLAIKLKKYLRRDKIIIYILGILCYRYLSEKVQIVIDKNIDESIVSYEEVWKGAESNEKIKKSLLDTLGYIIEPKNLFSEIIQSIREKRFEITNLGSAFSNLNTFFTDKSEWIFKDLFKELEFSIDISSKDKKSYIDIVEDILRQISLLNVEIDAELENSYLKVSNNLIDYFENNAKKDNEQLFTPKEISKLLINLVESNNDCDKIYDPVCGIGSLLVSDTLGKKLYGQEKNDNYNLTKMNLLLQGVEYRDFDIKLGDIFKIQDTWI